MKETILKKSLNAQALGNTHDEIAEMVNKEAQPCNRKQQKEPVILLDETEIKWFIQINQDWRHFNY